MLVNSVNKTYFNKQYNRIPAWFCYLVWTNPCQPLKIYFASSSNWLPWRKQNIIFTWVNEPV